MTSLRLVDEESAADLATYLARARRVDEGGFVRLQAVGPVLAAWTCVLPGRGLTNSGLVLGLRTFALATFLGIIPATFVYASVGNGLGAILDRGQEPDLKLVLEPQVLLPLLGLAALALLPVLYRRWKGRTA